MDITEEDINVMKLLHYFITEKGYNPVVVQGLNNEIWLENMKEEYEIIRINSNYIHNNEQFDMDQYKAIKISKSIRKKVMLSNLNILSIYTNLGDNASLSDDKHMTNIKISGEEDYSVLEKFNKVFPEMSKKLDFNEEGVDLYFKIAGDITKKNQSDMNKANEVFKEKKPFLTYGLIVVNVIVFILTYVLNDNLLNDYCLFGPYVRYGEYYRLFTSMFLHGGVLHLLFNMYALLVIGSKIESLMGRVKYITIYLLSGLCGSLLSMTLSNTASVGASGAIFGLMGSILYFGYHYRLYLGETLKSQIIPLIVVNLLYGFLTPGIDNFAHIGGLIGGVLITSAVGVKYKESKSEQINGIIISTIFIGFLIYMAFVMKGSV